MDAGAAESVPPAGSPRRRWTLVAAVLGVVLLGAAVWAVASQRGAAGAALDAARTAPAWLVGAVIVLPLVNWLLTAGVFWVLTGRYGRVRAVEMGALIASAWLLNYIPARAGLIGRVGYHKAVNGIRVRDAAAVIVQAIACTGAALAGLLGAIAAAAATGAPAWAMGVVMLGVGGGLIFAGVLLRHRAPQGRAWRWLTAGGLRFVDVTVWGVRYLAVFALAGVAASPMGVGVVTAASQASMLLPVQVGVREWVVGLSLGLMGGGATGVGVEGGAPAALLEAAAPGLAADLINRVAETLVAVPVGLWGTWWVVRRLRGAGTARGAHLPPGADLADSSGSGT